MEQREHLKKVFEIHHITHSDSMVPNSPLQLSTVRSELEVQIDTPKANPDTFWYYHFLD
jgi:hypothetical protein